jgi:hypothetical protein
MIENAKTSRARVTFQTGLEDAFRNIERNDPFRLLALAEVGHLREQACTWLDQVANGAPLQLGTRGARSVEDLMAVWTTLKTGSPDDTLAAMRSFLTEPSNTLYCVRDLIEPLALIGRTEILPAMCERLVDEGADAEFAINSILISLGAAGAWTEVLDVCAMWHSHGQLAFDRASALEAYFWKYIYHQHQTEFVLPRVVPLANGPPGPRTEHREWSALAFRIRAGRTDLHVPVIPRNRQPNGYYEAAAMQIAALEHEASARDHVAELRRVIGSEPTTIEVPGRGIGAKMDMEPADCRAQRIMIAAHRRDYAAVSAIVASSPHNPFNHPVDNAISAFLEEGDWRGAAGVAEAYDLRKRPVPRGFSDSRKQDYLGLQLMLAGSAACAGDTGAAELFLESYKLAHLLPDPPPDDDDENDDELVVPSEDATAASPVSNEPVDLWPATLIAGVAENRLPARFISMLLPVFP